MQPAAAEATLERRARRRGEQAVALRQVVQRPRRAHADLRRPRRAACRLDRARSPRGRLGLGVGLEAAQVDVPVGPRELAPG